MLKKGEIVANDTTQNLLKRFSGFYVQLSLEPHVLPPTLMPLLKHETESGFQLALKDYAEVEQVMATLRVAGAKVLEMEVVQPDLEEVFVKIMNQESA